MWYCRKRGIVHKNEEMQKNEREISKVMDKVVRKVL